MIGHVDPEAQVGGVLAVVRTGEPIRIDLRAREINLRVANEEIEARLRAFSPPPIKYEENQILRKYAKRVGGASKGAVTDN